MIHFYGAVSAIMVAKVMASIAHQNNPCGATVAQGVLIPNILIIEYCADKIYLLSFIVGNICFHLVVFGK